MITIRCKDCQKELTSTNRLQICGCPNNTQIIENKITAIDLSKVVIVKDDSSKINNERDRNILKPEDLLYQEERRKRKVKKLNFEIR